MDCCIEPGQIFVLPHKGGREELGNIFSHAKLQPPDVLYSVEDVLRHYGLKFPKSAPSYPVLIRVPPGEEHDRSAVLRGLRGIKTALPNYRLRPALAKLQYNESFINECLSALGLTGKPTPMHAGSKHRPVTVALLDTGMDGSVVRASGGEHLPQLDLDRPRDPGADYYDPCGHGTLVATLLVYGAPAARLLPVKVSENQGSLMAFAGGLYAAAARAWPQIFNLSLGFTLDTDRCPNCLLPRGDTVSTYEGVAQVFAELDALYQYHGEPPPLIVAAAGNVPAGAPVMLPAGLEGVLAVGACVDGAHPQLIGDYSRYSAIEPQRFVRAPGGGRSSVFATRPGIRDAQSSSHWEDEPYCGTSFAAPLVTAICARYLAITRDRESNGTADTRFYLMGCIRCSSRTDFAGFDVSSFGLGLARFIPNVARDVPRWRERN